MSETSYNSYNLDHLGLISAMVDELGLEELTDTLIPQDQQYRHVSIGKCVKAMILNGLGFANRTLYLMPHFFKDKPIERLLGEGIKAEHLNDDTIGRAMDSVFDCGTSNFYAQLAAQSVNRLGLSCKIGHLDSTTFHVDGDYNSRENAEYLADCVIHITQGYSRDHRPDLNQVVLQMICENQAGIPLWMKAMSGNSNDSNDFRETIKTHLSQLKESVGMSMMVADSALYAKETLHELGDFGWISRVPETIGGVSELCQMMAEEWSNSKPDRAVKALGSNYGGANQRWLVVYTRAAHERSAKTVNRQLLKQTEADWKAFEQLRKQEFACEIDAQAALDRFQKKLDATKIKDSRIIEIKKFKAKGRPKKDQQPDEICYQIQGNLCSSIDVRRKKIEKKCCFILATNELDETKLSDDQFFTHYTQDQQKVEGGFRFMKDPMFMANTLFLKSPKRIEVLMAIMTLCLLVYSALEYRIRQSLLENKATFPNQIGGSTDKPTARWVFQFFTGIHVLLVGGIQSVVLNCNVQHSSLLKLLGDRYVLIYSNSG
jgi:transposase